MCKIFIIFIFLLSFFPQVFPAAADGCLDRAAALKENGDYRRAIDCLLDCPSPDDHTNRYLAQLYFLNGLSPEALTVFSRIGKKEWRDFVYMGLAFEDIGKTGEAIASYAGSLALAKNSIALYRLGKIYYHDGALDKAKKYWEELLAYDSSVRIVNYHLGCLSLKEKNYKQAYGYLAKAAKFYPQNAMIKKRCELAQKLLGKSFFTKEKAVKEKQREEVKLPAYTPQRGAPTVKVGLASGLDEFVFLPAGPAVVAEGNRRFPLVPDKFYRVFTASDKIILADYKTKKELARFSDSIEIKAASSAALRSAGGSPQERPFYILDLSFGGNNFWHTQRDCAYRGLLRVTGGKGGLTLVNQLGVEDYLDGILPSEIAAGAPPEALKAQAVAARTFIFRNLGRHRKEGFDFCSGVHCQAYRGFLAEDKRTNLAVAQTEGEVVEYDGKVVEAFYHADCGGCLQSFFFGKRDYLKDKFDSPAGEAPGLTPWEEEEWVKTRPPVFCAGADKESNFRWQRIYDREDFFLVFGYALTKVRNIKTVEKSECFRCERVVVATDRGKIALDSGMKIRDYFDKLRSSLFKVEVQYPHDKAKLIIIWGAGFGHGAGLCQDGALAMAEKGYSYRDILKHYYPGTTIKKKY